MCASLGNFVLRHLYRVVDVGIIDDMDVAARFDGALGIPAGWKELVADEQITAGAPRDVRVADGVFEL